MSSDGDNQARAELASTRTELVTARETISKQSSDIVELKAMLEKQSAEIARLKADVVRLQKAPAATPTSGGSATSKAVGGAANAAARTSTHQVAAAAPAAAPVAAAEVAQRTVQAGTVTARLAMFQQNATKAIDAYVKTSTDAPKAAAANAATSKADSTSSGDASGGITPRDFSDYLKEQNGGKQVDEESDAKSE